MKHKIYRNDKKNTMKFLADGFSTGFVTSAGNDGRDLPILPGYVRELFVTDGSAVVVINGVKTEKVSFSDCLKSENFSSQSRSALKLNGEDSLKYFGDFKGYLVNIKKKDSYVMEYLTLSAEKMKCQIKRALDKNNNDFNKTGTLDRKCVLGVFCVDGYAIAEAGSDSFMMNSGDQLFVYGDLDELSEVGLMGDGHVIELDLAFEPDLVFDEESGTYESVKKNKQGKTKEKLRVKDFFLAILISLTNFRYSDKVVKFRKENWFDEELFHAVRSVTRKHIAALTWILLLICVCAAKGRDFVFTDLIVAALITAVVNVVLVMPVIYAFVLPRPVDKHIKKMSELTEEEKRIQEIRKSEVRRKKRALKRY